MKIIISLITIFLFLTITGCTSDSSTSNITDPPGDQTISFVRSQQTLGDAISFGISIADVDLDGDNDIFVGNYTGPSRLWLNDGNGNFTMSAQAFGSSSTNAHDTGIADLNGNSYPDIFVVNHDAPSRIYFNNGDNTFTISSQSIGTVGDNPQTIQLADVDGDGDVDAYIYNISAPNRIWENDGNGFFTMRNIDYGGDDSSGQVLADFNGDTFPDLYIVMRSAPVQIWMNDGTGNFTNSGQSLGSGSEAEVFGDIDGDGDIDMIIGPLVWLNQNNTGTFTAGNNLEDESLWFRSELFDADLDGDLDLLVAYFQDGTGLWLNDGTGVFSYNGPIFGTPRALSIAYGKLDDNNYYDIVLGFEPENGGISIYFNESAP